MAEFAFMKEVLAAFGRGSVRLFRANSGMAWTGRVVSHTKQFITIADPRTFHGMPAGTSDLIGWQSIEITPDMVGQRVAVFVAVECKTPAGRPTEAQAAFLSAVRRAGGRAVLARSTGDVAAALGPAP
jgi:hypothetical protein